MSYLATTPRNTHTTPEQLLWLAVIDLAIRDALALPRVEAQGKDQARRMDCRRAADWLAGNSRDFHTVCSLAGIAPEFLREAWLSGRITAENYLDERFHWVAA